MIYQMLDAICAESLQTDVDVFVKTIESTTEWRRSVILSAALDTDNVEKLEQARRCFRLINTQP